MRKVVLCAVLALLAAFSLPRGSGATVEGEVLKTLPTNASPLDVATSADGQWTFVLLHGGEVLVYSAGGQPEGSLDVGEGAERIASSPRGDQLVVTSGNPKQVSIVRVDFVYPIDITGSPFKGPEDAPVVVAVYSDFQ